MRRLTLTAFFVAASVVPLVAQPPVNVTPGPRPNDQAMYGQKDAYGVWVQALQDAMMRRPLTRADDPDAERRRQRERDCLRAVGDKAFCKCFREKSPANATYADYSTVVTHSKEQLRYQQLDKDTKAYVEQLLSVRAVCVPRGQANK